MSESNVKKTNIYNTAQVIGTDTRPSFKIGQKTGAEEKGATSTNLPAYSIDELSRQIRDLTTKFNMLIAKPTKKGQRTQNFLNEFTGNPETISLDEELLSLPQQHFYLLPLMPYIPNPLSINPNSPTSIKMVRIFSTAWQNVLDTMRTMDVVSKQDITEFLNKSSDILKSKLKFNITSRNIEDWAYWYPDPDAVQIRIKEEYDRLIDDIRKASSDLRPFEPSDLEAYKQKKAPTPGKPKKVNIQLSFKSSENDPNPKSVTVYDILRHWTSYTVAADGVTIVPSIDPRSRQIECRPISSQNWIPSSYFGLFASMYDIIPFKFVPLDEWRSYYLSLSLANTIIKQSKGETIKSDDSRFRQLSESLKMPLIAEYGLENDSISICPDQVKTIVKTAESDKLWFLELIGIKAYFPAVANDYQEDRPLRFYEKFSNMLTLENPFGARIILNIPPSRFTDIEELSNKNYITTTIYDQGKSINRFNTRVPLKHLRDAIIYWFGARSHFESALKCKDTLYSNVQRWIERSFSATKLEHHLDDVKDVKDFIYDVYIGGNPKDSCPHIPLENISVEQAPIIEMGTSDMGILTKQLEERLKFNKDKIGSKL